MLSNGEKDILILVTESYPYTGASERTFIEPELEYLSRYFRVIIVPERCIGEKTDTASIEIDLSYAELLSRQGKRAGLIRRALTSSAFYREVAARPTLLIQPLSLMRLVAFAGRAEIARRWVSEFYTGRSVSPRNCIVYTFWCYATTTGMGLAKDDISGTVLVSRAHGGDLYEERHPHSYIPCRTQSLKRLEGLFPDSEAGSAYLTNRYPEISSICETHCLGVKDPGFLTPASSDGVIRIVSCSFMVPVKRVHLILEAIASAAAIRPNQKFEWHHFGTGPLKSSIQASAEKFPSNVKSFFPGYSSVENLMRFYRDSCVDVFINVSETEGTPVAVMEAISCGIPLIVTAVGGNKEIAGGENGILLSEHPTPDQVAAAIFEHSDDVTAATARREKSRKVWEDKYNADVVFPAFAERLKQIRETHRAEVAPAAEMRHYNLL